MVKTFDTGENFVTLYMYLNLFKSKLGKRTPFLSFTKANFVQAGKCHSSNKVHSFCVVSVNKIWLNLLCLMLRFSAS